MPPRVKELQAQIAALQNQVAEMEAAKEAAEKELQHAQATIDEQAAALNSTNPDSHESTAADGGTRNEMIPRPKPQKGRHIRIRQGMRIDLSDYKAIQRTIRKLVVKVSLDWTKDFRLQDAEKLAMLYSLARQAYPVLGRYEDNWATAELAKQYMQNARSHARSEGYLEKAGRKGKEREQSRAGAAEVAGASEEY
ncbi:hypothetical protein BD414DRAFT_533757 [Trametes punicea]|nr:hypothetical protein BD414DRAFT_533757 [Trametes punicea]